MTGLGRLPPIREALFRISPFVRCRPELEVYKSRNGRSEGRRWVGAPVVDE